MRQAENLVAGALQVAARAQECFGGIQHAEPSRIGSDSPAVGDDVDELGRHDGADDKQVVLFVEEHDLDGISVECFPMIREKKVTACPSLALLNKLKIPAACEGDMVSLAGMMLIRSIFNKVPWMANLSGVKDNEAQFSHCSVPLDLLRQYTLNTHFETQLGLAIEGILSGDEFTVFRLDKYMMKAFVAEGVAIEKHPFGITVLKSASK